MDVWRHGWPDFAVRDRVTGAIYAVEVKHGGDVVSEGQAAMFSLLEEAGVPVFVWHTARPNKLVPWRRFTERAQRRSERLPKSRPVVHSVEELRAKGLAVAMVRARAAKEALQAIAAGDVKAPTTMREYADSVA